MYCIDICMHYLYVYNMCYKLSYRILFYLKLFEFCRKIYNLAENALT